MKKELWEHQKYAIEKYKNKNYFGLLFDMGLGKEQPLSSKILTPTGYIQMGDVELNTSVLDGDGKPTFVTAIYPQGIKKIFRINFTDNTYIRVGEEHLNIFIHHTRYGQKQVVLTTEQLIQGLERNNKYWCLLPVCQFQEAKTLPLHPYLLGVLLGDGCLESGQLQVSLLEDDVKNKVVNLLSEIGCTLHQIGKRTNYRITNSQGLRKILNDLNLCCKSKDKYIPKMYLLSSVEDRIQLLQGLFDTNGSICVNRKKKCKGHAQGGGCSFSYDTCSEQLSQDFAFLVRSLGLVDRVQVRQAKYKRFGVYKITGKDYRHSIKCPNGFPICTSKKHLSKILPRQVQSPMRKVVSVTFDGYEECQCITVNSTKHTYITDNVTVTHNTYTVTRIAEEKEKPVLIIAPNCLCSQWKEELENKNEDRITTKDWNVLLCTSDTKKTKKFQKDFDDFIKD